MTRWELYLRVKAERFGASPAAERARPLLRDFSDGGPDTPQAVTTRRRVLLRALGDRYGHWAGAPHARPSTLRGRRAA